MIVNELNAAEVGRKLVECTPQAERSKLKAFYLSPELVTDDVNTIGSQQSRELRPYGMPGAAKADNERVGGWGLMFYRHNRRCLLHAWQAHAASGPERRGYR